MIPAPQLLIAFRAACAPLIFVLACYRFRGIVLASVVLAAFLSDVLDGMIARVTGRATPALRYADTLVDTIFFVAAAIALRVAVPAAFAGLWLPLVTLIVVHVSRWTFELTKYGRIAPYHMWSSKALGVVLVGALVTAFVTGRPTVLLRVGLWLGVLNELEGFVASLLLSEWRHDVPTVFHVVSGQRSAVSGQRQPPTAHRLLTTTAGSLESSSSSSSAPLAGPRPPSRSVRRVP